jgi:glycosyltransferase involved in cell wall biosynthesis
MGMGGVQRTAKFVKYLPHYGWEPHILTISPKAYLAHDDCLLHELEKENVVIHRTAGNGNENGTNGTKVVQFKNDSTRKFLSNLSQSFLIPDSKIFWKSKAVKLGSEIIEKENINLIYATAPPYTDFLIAYELKKLSGLPMVLDYRDSWLDCPNNFYLTPYHRHLHFVRESKVLRSADKIVTINQRIKELITERYTFKKPEEIKVIPQGFDGDDFKNVSVNQDYSPKLRFTYAGSFLNYYTPEYFLNALARFFEQTPEARNNIEAYFIGTIDKSQEKLISKYKLNDVVRVLGYVSHSECIGYLLKSDILWMMINRTHRSDLHSTGKLYEYLGSRKPILACVPEGVARNSLKDYGAVKICEPDDVNCISKSIEEFYILYKNNSLPEGNEEMINKYERKYLTGLLADLFSDVRNIVKQNAAPSGAK